MVELACIVEGDGEEAALPSLISRIVAEYCPGAWVRTVITTNFHGRDRFQDERMVSRAVDNAMRRLGVGGAILVLRDADNDCPVREAERLKIWAQTARSDARLSIVIAVREYESWFIAAAESLRGFHGLRDDVRAPEAIESISDAKGWLTRQMGHGQPYKPTVHQKPFSQQMNLGLARERSLSFDKLCRDVQRLVEAIQAT